ncbi:Monocarboxylate transporter 12 [Orchesella cincta]|uniref:Monocarboxylate transporter 12 n=1 Tax=Orchesella cincta TaxID=48709 RepID=A0A1D2MIL9_ORCCI|nr:Monocarboxylate transporter 12 [Orchesella cincta]
MWHHPLVSFVIYFLDAGLTIHVVSNFLYHQSDLGGIEYTCFALIFVVRFLVAPIASFIIRKIGCRTLSMLTGLLASVLILVKPLFPRNGLAEFMIFGAGILLAFPVFCSDINAVQYPQTRLGIALSGKVFGLFVFAPEKQRLIEGLPFENTNSETSFFIYVVLTILITVCGAFVWSPTEQNDGDPLQSPSSIVVARVYSADEHMNIVWRGLCWINVLIYISFFMDVIDHFYGRNSSDALHYGEIFMDMMFYSASAVIAIYLGHLYNRKQTLKALSVFWWSFPVAWIGVVVIPILFSLFFVYMKTTAEKGFPKEFAEMLIGRMTQSGSLAFLLPVIANEVVTLAALSQVVNPMSYEFMKKYAKLMLIRGAAMFFNLILFLGVPYVYRLLFLSPERNNDDEKHKLTFAFHFVLYTAVTLCSTIKIVRVVSGMAAAEKKHTDENTLVEMQPVAV